jgi:hypothetical protein
MGHYIIYTNPINISGKLDVTIFVKESHIASEFRMYYLPICWNSRLNILVPQEGVG